MHTYLFTRETRPVGRLVNVTHNGDIIARLNLANRVQRGLSIQKLTRWLGERSATKLVAFGTPIIVESEEEFIF